MLAPPVDPQSPGQKFAYNEKSPFPNVVQEKDRYDMDSIFIEDSNSNMVSLAL